MITKPMHNTAVLAVMPAKMERSAKQGSVSCFVRREASSVTESVSTSKLMLRIAGHAKRLVKMAKFVPMGNAH